MDNKDTICSCCLEGICGGHDEAKPFYRKISKKDGIRVCVGGSCIPNGARGVLAKLEEHLGIAAGEENETVSLDTHSCTGYCSLGPNVEVNGNVIRHNTSQNTVEKIEEARKLPQGQGWLSTHDLDTIDLDSILEKDGL